MQTRFLSNVPLASAASVQAVTARNLQLLQAIDNTVDSLCSDTQLFAAIAEGFQEILDALQKCDGGGRIDSQGIIRGSLQRAAEATARIHARATQARQSACEDRQLHPDDGVVEAYDDYIRALESVQHLTEEIKEWIEIQDASHEPPSGRVYSSVESLLEALSRN